jgi:hypothetical protein
MTGTTRKAKTMSPSMKQSLDRIFEFAVLANWEDLMRDRQSGLIHVEYGYSSSGREG